VEVDEKIETHQLYKDIVNNNIAYGAERWLLELQRMCARFTCAEPECIPNYDFSGGSCFYLYSKPINIYATLINTISVMNFQ